MSPPQRASKITKGSNAALDANAVAVSVSPTTAGADDLAVEARPPEAGQGTCLVAARPPAYRRQVCEALRDAGLAVRPLNSFDEVAAVPEAVGPLVVLVAIEDPADPPPALADTRRQIITMALLDDATTDVKTAALRSGWHVVLDRDADMTAVAGAARDALLATSRARRPPADDTSPIQARSAAAEQAAREAIALRAFTAATAGQPLGDGVSPLTRVPPTLAWQQMFESAWVLWHPDLGAFVLRRDGGIAQRYEALGGPAGELGFPVTDETPVGIGTMCEFELPGGALAWHPRLGVHKTSGPIGKYWLDLGGSDSRWGFPTSDEYVRRDGSRAIDFEGGTLMWRPGSGMALLPADREFDASDWLALLDEPPHRAISIGRFAELNVSTDYGDPDSGARRRTHDAAFAAMSEAIESCRALLPDPRATDVGVHRDRPPTSVTPDEVLAVNGTRLPPGISADDLYRAQHAVWHDVWGDTTGTTVTIPDAQLMWAGFEADGELEQLVAMLCERAPAARELMLHVGMAVEQVGNRLAFVVADTDRAWRLYGADAERYIAHTPRLLAFFTAMAQGVVSPALLELAHLPASTNDELRQAAVDAEFLTVVAGAGRLPGWSLLPPWTPALRAAVAHNIRAGCLTGWQAFEHTAGDPVEVVRTIAWDFFCGTNALLVQSPERFEGPVGHSVLRTAAMSFPPAERDDDGHGIYIAAGGTRRRVDRPTYPPFTG